MKNRDSPRLSLHHGPDDRRHHVPDPLDLGQGRRHAAARHRSDGASAWTGGRGQMLDTGGQVARFNKRFGGLSLGKK